MKVLKIGIFRHFLTEYKIHYLAIFLPNSIVTGLPYLPAKDELVSLNRLSSWGLWKWYNSKVLDRWLYGVGQCFSFCRFSRERKILWKLWLWYSKMFHQRVFSDWMWRISKCPFWLQILDIYRQQLLIMLHCYKTIHMSWNPKRFGISSFPFHPIAMRMTKESWAKTIANQLPKYAEVFRKHVENIGKK